MHGRDSADMILVMAHLQAVPTWESAIAMICAGAAIGCPRRADDGQGSSGVSQPWRPRYVLGCTASSPATCYSVTSVSGDGGVGNADRSAWRLTSKLARLGVRARRDMCCVAIGSPPGRADDGQGSSGVCDSPAAPLMCRDARPRLCARSSPGSRARRFHFPAVGSENRSRSSVVAAV